MNVTVLQVERKLAAVVRASVGFRDMPQAQRRARLALDAVFHGKSPAGPRLTIWQPLLDGLVDYAPGIVIPAPVEVSGDVELFTLPAGRAAHLRFDGSYEGLGGAWQALFGACSSGGMETAGLNWELYIAGDAAPDEVGADLYAMLT